MPPVKKPKPKLGSTYLKEWRSHRNLSQEVAADRIGISRANLSKIENGAIPYSQPILEAAAHAYSCDVVDLLSVNPLKEGIVVDIMNLIKDRDPDLVRRVIEALPKRA
jgi:transcriptional regulator with XRE-family HTH domain